MLTHRPTLHAMLVVMLIAVGVGIWSGMPLASAGAKDPKPKAPVPQTGQTQCWAGANTPIPCPGTGQDGEFQAGVSLPVPRFTDRGDGTVRDHLTGLIWLKDARCLGVHLWADALAAVEALNAGVNFSCVGYAAGTFADWRLPNIKELHSLMHFGFAHPVLSNAAGTAQWREGNAFSGVQAGFYWSSTSDASNQGLAWTVAFSSAGNTLGNGKDSHYQVWAVRGGE